MTIAMPDRCSRTGRRDGTRYRYQHVSCPGNSPDQYVRGGALAALVVTVTVAVAAAGVIPSIWRPAATVVVAVVVAIVVAIEAGAEKPKAIEAVTEEAVPSSKPDP